MSLLTFGWATFGVPRLASTALGLLWFAALGGVLAAQARRWRQAPSPELLAFGHMAVAAAGFVLLLAAALGGSR